MSVVSSISRRAMVGAAASLVAAPALAEECHIGPAPHEQGPSVFLDYDQVELDAAYDQSFYAPLGRQIRARYTSNSAAVRYRLGQPLRRCAGPTEVEKLDIYKTTRANAPIFVFIHGGAWLGGRPAITASRPSYSSTPASTTSCSISSPSKRRTAICASWPTRSAARSPGSTRMRRASAAIRTGFTSAAIPRAVIYAASRSSPIGARTSASPPTSSRAGSACSGMYDLKPVRLSKRSAYVKFDR